jgi:hypothetical protein
MPETSDGAHRALPWHYSPSVVDTLKAAVQAVRPNDGGFESVDDDRTVRTVLSFVPYMPRGVRLAWPFGLWLLDKATVVYGFRGRFRKLSVDDRRAALLRLRGSRTPLRAMVDGMRSLIMLSFYQQPEVLRLLEVDWESRARELIERRARLQEMAEVGVAGRDGTEGGP